jgi:hypothetical protein
LSGVGRSVLLFDDTSPAVAAREKAFSEAATLVTSLFVASSTGSRAVPEPWQCAFTRDAAPQAPPD